MLNGVSYLAVIWSLFEMELPRRERRQFGATMMRQVRLGLAYVWRHRPTLWLLVLVAINMGIGMQYTVLIPLFARDLLHVGAHGYGFLMAAQGLGAVASAIVMNMRSTAPKSAAAEPGVRNFLHVDRGRGLRPVEMDVLSLLTQMFVGVGLMNHMVTTNTLLQMFVTEQLRGRVMSISTRCRLSAPRRWAALRSAIIGEHFNPRTRCCSARLSRCCAGFILLTKLKLIAQAQAEIEEAT